jgi:hypothetical protein
MSDLAYGKYQSNTVTVEDSDNNIHKYNRSMKPKVFPPSD